MSPITVRLPDNIKFSKKDGLERLNEALADREGITPGQLKRASGCTLVEAMSLLLLLYELNYAEAFLLIYNKETPDDAIRKQPFSKGFPKLPFSYRLHGISYRVRSRDELFYAYVFDLIVDVEFLVEANLVPL